MCQTVNVITALQRRMTARLTTSVHLINHSCMYIVFLNLIVDHSSYYIVKL